MVLSFYISTSNVGNLLLSFRIYVPYFFIFSNYLLSLFYFLWLGNLLIVCESWEYGIYTVFLLLSSVSFPNSKCWSSSTHFLKQASAWLQWTPLPLHQRTLYWAKWREIFFLRSQLWRMKSGKGENVYTYDCYFPRRWRG